MPDRNAGAGQQDEGPAAGLVEVLDNSAYGHLFFQSHSSAGRQRRHVDQPDHVLDNPTAVPPVDAAVRVVVAQGGRVSLPEHGLTLSAPRSIELQHPLFPEPTDGRPLRILLRAILVLAFGIPVRHPFPAVPVRVAEPKLIWHLLA